MNAAKMPATSVVPAIGPALWGKAGYRGGECVRYLRCGIGYHFALRIGRCRELAMKIFVRCGTLFTGAEDETRRGEVLVIGDDGRLAFVGPEQAAPQRAADDKLIDHSAGFVMPGLIDVHTHLAYGNAKCEEDIDLYQPMEFRALRALFFAQKVLMAGYTSICAPGDAGQISLSVRDAINFGLFDGPRVT